MRLDQVQNGLLFFVVQQGTGRINDLFHQQEKHGSKRWQNVVSEKGDQQRDGKKREVESPVLPAETSVDVRQSVLLPQRSEKYGLAAHRAEARGMRFHQEERRAAAEPVIKRAGPKLPAERLCLLRVDGDPHPNLIGRERAFKVVSRHARYFTTSMDSMIAQTRSVLQSSSESPLTAKLMP